MKKMAKKVTFNVPILNSYRSIDIESTHEVISGTEEWRKTMKEVY